MALPVESPGPNNQSTLALIRELFSDARRAKRQLIPTWNRYYRLSRNKTWSEHRQAWLPAPSSSEIFPAFHTLTSWMTDQRPRMFCSPAPPLGEFHRAPDEQAQQLISQKARDMQSVLDAVWILQSMQAQLGTALWDTFTFGAGILKTGWDPAAAGGDGQVTMTRTDPYALLQDPQAASFDDCRFVIEARQVPMFEIWRRFPERAHLVEPDGGPSNEIDQRPQVAGAFEVVPQGQLSATGVTGAFPGVATPGIPPLFGPPKADPSQYTKTVLLKECWVRSSERMTLPVIEDGHRVDDVQIDVPRWDLVCEANNVILNEDTSNPFDHGLLPYTRIPMVETGEFWSIPLAEHLAPAQIALNRLLAALQANAELVGNPILIDPDNSGIARTKIVNRPGGRLNPHPGQANNIRWLDPPSMPAQVMELVSYWQQTIDRISGVSAVARGGAMRRREPAAGVDAVQEASMVRIRAVLRNMEEALRRSGDQLASNVVQFYAEPRSIPMIGPNGSQQYLQLGQMPFMFPQADPTDPDKVDDIALKFDVWIEAGSSLPLSRTARAAEIDSLFFMGAVDAEAVLEAHDVPDRQNVLARVRTQQSQMQQQGTRNPRNR